MPCFRAAAIFGPMSSAYMTIPGVSIHAVECEVTNAPVTGSWATHRLCTAPLISGTRSHSRAGQPSLAPIACTVRLNANDECAESAAVRRRWMDDCHIEAASGGIVWPSPAGSGATLLFIAGSEPLRARGCRRAGRDRGTRGGGEAGPRRKRTFYTGSREYKQCGKYKYKYKYKIFL